MSNSMLIERVILIRIMTYLLYTKSTLGIT